MRDQSSNDIREKQKKTREEQEIYERGARKIWEKQEW